MKKLLKELNACKEATEWAGDKTWEEVYNTCERGDWLLWLFARTNPEDFQLLILAKAHCANTVRHLMVDERSKNAVDVAIAFGLGKATREELAAAYAASAAASAAAYAAYAASASYAAAYAAAYASASYAAAYAASASYAAAYASYAASAAASASYAARKKNQLLTADICRLYLPINIWNV